MLEQNDEKDNEKIIEELNNTDIESRVKNEELIQEDDIKELKPTFMNTCMASIIDLIVIGAVSTVLLFVADAVLKLSGYAITQMFQMSFVIFMVVMVLYMSIMESGKMSATLGKKVAGLYITKR